MAHDPSTAEQLTSHQRTWDAFAEEDLFWALFTRPDKKNGKWEEKDFFETGTLGVDAYLEKIHAQGLEIKKEAALEFGCGAGRLTRALCRHFRECHGVDVSPKMLEAAQRYNSHPEKCFYHLNQRPDLSLFPDESFDFILSILTLQHIEPEIRANYLREFVRVAKPGGVIYFQLIGREIASGRCGHRHAPEGGENSARSPAMEFYGEEESRIRQIVESCGARLIHVESFSTKIWMNHFYLIQKKDRAARPEGGFPYEIVQR